jgi:Flp pilus assembly protein TadD
VNELQYRVALLQAEHACPLAPDPAAYHISLGAALCRAGRCREAIETLGTAARPDTGSPVIPAFLAMGHYQLGQREQASAGLARLREVLDQPRWTKDAETLELVREAQALIAPQAATIAR